MSRATCIPARTPEDTPIIAEAAAFHDGIVVVQADEIAGQSELPRVRYSGRLGGPRLTSDTTMRHTRHICKKRPHDDHSTGEQRCDSGVRSPHARPAGSARAARPVVTPGASAP